MGMDIFDAENFLGREREAENYAVPFVYGINFSDCLRMYQIPTEREVDGKKIQAHRIYGLWETYLIAEGEVTGAIITMTTKGGKEKEKPVAKQPDIFTDSAESHQARMYIWITTKYTDVYKSIATEEEKTWLRTVIRFVVYRRIMESKYHKWITTGKGFADREVAAKIADVYRLKDEMPAAARLIHTVLENCLDILKTGRDIDIEELKRQLAQDIISGLFDLLRTDRLRLLPPMDPKQAEPKQLDEGKDAL